MKSGRKFTADYGMGETATREKKHPDGVIYAEFTDREERGSAHSDVGLEKSAGEVFTKDFNPIDFAKSEKEAARPSSRAAFTTAAKPVIEERVSAITEEASER